MDAPSFIMTDQDFYFILFFLHLFISSNKFSKYIMAVYDFPGVSEYVNECVSRYVSISCPFSWLFSSVWFSLFCFYHFYFILLYFILLLSLRIPVCFLTRDKKGMDPSVRAGGRNSED